MKEDDEYVFEAENVVADSLRYLGVQLPLPATNL